MPGSEAGPSQGAKGSGSRAQTCSPAVSSTSVRTASSSGKVERGETPRAAAVRELWEETGLRGELLAAPAAVAVRSYRADWSPTLGLSYAAVVVPDVQIGGESGQPPKWFALDEDWESVFPEDRHRIRAYARRLAARPTA